MAHGPETCSRSSKSTGSDRDNNFGLLRLLFATLVIFSHSFELVDGNRSRELLTRLSGTLSFGEFGVDGFFLLSGYLITKSYLANRGLEKFLLKRALRIVPGYMVSFWICVLLLAPMVGAGAHIFSPHALARQLGNSLLLLQPDVQGIFASLHYPQLNGSMWTIAYEFAFYLATALFGLIGLYRPQYRAIVLAGALLSALMHGYGYTHVVEFGGIAPASLNTLTRLATFYLFGSICFLYSEKIRFTNFGAIIAATVLLPLIFSGPVAELALLISGGYLIFWFALCVPALPLSRVLQDDISYGMYLYGWPIQSLLIWNHPDINPWFLCVLSIALAAGCGYLSWHVVEKPALEIHRGISLSAVRRKLVGSTP